jgi:hypothetical protein
MLKSVTGRSTDYYQISDQMAVSTNGWIYDKILYDTQNGIDVLFSSNSGTSYGLVADHMFAVVGVDQSTGNYILFNPWGYAVTAQAEFELTPQELNTLYSQGTDDEFLAADGSYYVAEAAALCHLAGTRILTVAGERPIESLRIGDKVVTRFGGVQRIKWIGEQHYDGRFIAGNPDKIPVRIMQGALGNALPRRDLVLSPGHSLLLHNILVLAKDLVNGVTITQDQPQSHVSYYNIELDAHDCILAEGSWSETYADCASLRRCFHNAASFWALYPYKAPPADPALCAPRPRAGAIHTAVLAQLLSTAERAAIPGPIMGFVEQIDDDITGWAYDPNNPDLPVRLHIYAGQNLIGLCFALNDRADVRQAGFGADRCGFSFPRPAETDPADITVRHAASGAIVPLLAPLAKNLTAEQTHPWASGLVAR